MPDASATEEREKERDRETGWHTLERGRLHVDLSLFVLDLLRKKSALLPTPLAGGGGGRSGGCAQRYRVKEPRGRDSTPVARLRAVALTISSAIAKSNTLYPAAPRESEPTTSFDSRRARSALRSQEIEEEI